MKLPPVIVKETGPAIGWTDFTNVYILRKIDQSPRYREILVKHEYAHIFLHHKYRGRQLLTKLQEKDKEAGVDFRLWNVACDMEIAQHIYTDQDNNRIAEFGSPLNGGIVVKDAQELIPDPAYAEDYYDALIKKSEEEDSKQYKANICISDEYEDESESEGESGGAVGPEDALEDVTEEVIEEQIKKLKEALEDQKTQEKVKNQVKKQMEDILSRPPTLAGEIDRHLGRYRAERVKSYARPPRVESSNIIRKGRKTKLMSPRVTVIVDRSGSFTPAKTQAATEAMKNALLKYRGRVRFDVLYFGNDVYTEEPTGSHGTNYQAVYERIMKDASELTVVITDDDSCILPDIEIPKTRVLVVPIGCSTTQFAKAIKATEVTL